MGDDWLADEIRARSAVFWARGKADMWPVEVQGHVLLATAMLKVGAQLFHDWSGDEPSLWFVPALDGSRPYAADGYDAIFAGSLLAQYRPEMFARICERENQWLLDEEWVAAEEVYRTHIHAQRASAARKISAVHKRMTQALANGDLVSVTRTDGEFRPIPAALWVDESVAYARFIESQMDPTRPHIQNWPTIYQIPPFSPRPTLVPGNDWIFVTTASLQSFLKALKGGSKAPPAQTRHYSDPAIDAELDKLYRAYAHSLADRPKRDGPDGVVDLIRQRLPGVPAERVKARYAVTRPADWKQGRRPGH